MIIDSRLLTEWQSCRRRWLLDSEWRALRWRPKALFDSVMRRAIVRMSHGTSWEDAASEAKTMYLQTAANPGLDLPPGSNPYVIARDWCAMIATILATHARVPILTLAEYAPMTLTGSIEWRFLSHRDESGMLHRFIFVDRLDSERLTSEMHGWGVFGDVAVGRVPMQIHVVEIGQQRAGRRASCWARGYRHPALRNLPMRFRRKDGEAFSGWKPVYLADDPQADVAAWVDHAWREGAAQAAMHTVDVLVPSDQVCDDTVVQIVQEAVAMRRAWEDRGTSGWRALPMVRGACDGPFTPCAFVDCCYVDGRVDPGDLGLYQRRQAQAAGPAALPTKQDDARGKVIPVVV